MLPRAPLLLPRDDDEAAFPMNESPPPQKKAPGAYYRTQAPLYHYRDQPSSGDGWGEDAGALVGLVVCLCLLLLLAFSVSYPLSTYYYYTPEHAPHPATAWTHGNEMYVRPP